MAKRTSTGSRPARPAQPNPPLAQRPRSNPPPFAPTFEAPAPRGVVPRLNSGAVVDDEELKAFGMERSGQGTGRAEAERVGRVRDAALRGAGLTAAQLRMRGRAREEETWEAPEKDDQDNPEPDVRDQEYANQADGEPDSLDAAEREELEYLRARARQKPATKLATKPTAPAPPPQPALSLRPVEVEDLDRMWDWIRADVDQGAAFFSRPIANSLELHQVFRGLLDAETRGFGLVRSIGIAQTHLGFLMLAPMLTTERVTLMHVYLSLEYRNELARVAAALMDEVQALVPEYQLAVYSASDAWARLHWKVLEPLGFARHTLFVR